MRHKIVKQVGRLVDSQLDGILRILEGQTVLVNRVEVRVKSRLIPVACYMVTDQLSHLILGR